MRRALFVYLSFCPVSRDYGPEFSRPFHCMYMYVQLHVHVYAIAHTCTCNEFDVLCWLSRQVGQRKSACLDGYRNTRIVLTLAGAMAASGRQFTSISTSERVGWMCTVSRN